MNLNENVIIPLRNFELPRDFAARVGALDALNDYRENNPDQRLPDKAPRFHGYFFRQNLPFAVVGQFTVSLENRHPINSLPKQVQAAVGPFSICSTEHGVDPLYLLIHDSLYGNCWLQFYEHGLRFLQATEAQVVARSNKAW